MIKQISLTSVLLASVALAGCSSNDDDPIVVPQPSALGDTVIVANTFEDTALTGGAQTIFGLSDPVTISDPEVELPGYIGFYDINLSASSLTMKLIDNSQAADLILPEGRFDRYYVGFGNHTAASVTLDGTDELNEFATVSLLPAGFVLSAEDLFVTGIAQPVTFTNGGVLIELGAGTDLTELNQMVKVNFTTGNTASDVEQAINVFINADVTNGVPMTVDAKGPAPIGAEVEFPGFAFGVYDVDATPSQVKMTLATDPSSLQVATYDGNTSDLYYYEFDSQVASASISSAAEGFVANVDIIPPSEVVTTQGSFVDGLATSFTLTNGGILVTIGEGSSLRTVGQGGSLTVDVTFK